MPKAYQKPIDSGFGHGSTCLDVVSGIDLTGQTAIVTGGYSGIGIETVRALSSAGADVIVPARRPDAAREALSHIGGHVAVGTMDLGDLSSVRQFADAFLESGKPLDILINNAGVMACPEGRVGPGWELQFGTNHMGHFALTKTLMPALQKADGARVVALSSTAHKISDIRWDDMQFENGSYDKWQAYGQAKTANSLFAVGLDQKYADQGIRAYGVHPGGIMTPLQRHLPQEEMIALGWLDKNGEMPEQVKAIFKTPEQGGATATWCATSPAMSTLGGVYCEDCNVAQLGDENSPRWAHVQPHAVNEESAERLWAISEDLLKVA
ncbi:SDR family NAD(P)-dependent oxidoreductase [Ponticaulis profundi]|uniref:SDR family NAD(P)-dependent oxidoreductase n=1 Tax=Ponticaulis profundi TaxID=2665222 RepID=A0ABW1S8X7_9PROT